MPAGRRVRNTYGRTETITADIFDITYDKGTFVVFGKENGKNERGCVGSWSNGSWGFDILDDPSVYDYSEMLSANGQIVILPEGLRSADGGKTWTKSGALRDWHRMMRRVAYGGDRIIVNVWTATRTNPPVVVGNTVHAQGVSDYAKIMCSADGVNWTESGMETNPYSAFAYGGGRWVFFKYYSPYHRGYLSAEGAGPGETQDMLWQETLEYDDIFHKGYDVYDALPRGSEQSAFNFDAIRADAYDVRAIVYGNGRFIVGGRKQVAPDVYSSRLAYSDDGRTWTEIAGKPLGDMGITSLSYTGGWFIAGGFNGRMAYSADGIAWTPIETPFSEEGAVRKVAFGQVRMTRRASQDNPFGDPDSRGTVVSDITCYAVVVGNSVWFSRVRNVFVSDSTLKPGMKPQGWQEQ
jgi:hypothetical protein